MGLFTIFLHKYPVRGRIVVLERQDDVEELFKKNRRFSVQNHVYLSKNKLQKQASSAR